MSRACRCDVCGKFCSDCYVRNGFDIYPGDYAKRGYPDVNKKTVINEICDDCYNDIESYIHDKVFEAAKNRIKDSTN